MQINLFLRKLRQLLLKVNRYRIRRQSKKRRAKQEIQYESYKHVFFHISRSIKKVYKNKENTPYQPIKKEKASI